MFSVRPVFLLFCTAVLAVVFMPDLFVRRHTAQSTLLLVAAVAVVLSWFYLAHHPEQAGGWGRWIAIATSVYLSLSIPVFFLELSPVRWFMGHHVLSVYAWPWVHWGYVMVYLGFIASFFGKGRARFALVVASTLMVVVWEASNRWVF